MSIFNKIFKSKKREEMGKTMIRDEKATRIANKIVNEIMKEQDLLVGIDIPTDVSLKAYTPIYTKIINLMLEEDVKFVDISYILSIVSQPYAFIKDIVINSMANNYDNAIAKKFGLENERDVTINDIDKALKELEIEK